jgi:hypothetical protein
MMDSRPVYDPPPYDPLYDKQILGAYDYLNS